MGIESPVHLLFIAVVALIVLGPKRLPQLARALGQGLREFRGSLEEGARSPETPIAGAQPQPQPQQPAPAQPSAPPPIAAESSPPPARPHAPAPAPPVDAIFPSPPPRPPAPAE